MTQRINLSRLTALLVDDEPDLLFTLSAVLEYFRANVTTCTSGMQAFDLICTRQFNCVILDIVMPQVDGWTLIRAVRAHPDPKISLMPVIALTARVNPQEKERLFAAGFDQYFSKPPIRDVFLAYLQKRVPRLG